MSDNPLRQHINDLATPINPAHAAPAAAALHAYAAAWLARTDFDTVFELHEALLNTHRATTPSEVPSSHVIVERAELDWLRLIADGVGELLLTEAFDEASPVVAHLRWVADQLAGTDRV